jgi:alpha-beta hydrolase superfamily lysophospholipase
MEKVVFSSEGVELYGTLREAEGSGPWAVVICHGAFEYQDNWFYYAERFTSEGLSTLTFDFVGHGESQGIRNLVNLRVWAYNIRDALNFLETRGYQKFALVGWDSGGSAVLLVAAHDRRLKCAVALSTPVLLTPPLVERIIFSFATLVAKVKKTIWKKQLTLSRINQLPEMRFMVDDNANEQYLANPRLKEIYRAVPIPDSLDSVWIDITRAIKRINIPVLVIHGAKDHILPVNQSQKLHALLQSPKDLQLIGESGHAVHLDQEKDEVYNLIARWVTIYLKN